jgi:hypothetical protein
LNKEFYDLMKLKFTTNFLKKVSKKNDLGSELCQKYHVKII